MLVVCVIFALLSLIGYAGLLIMENAIYWSIENEIGFWATFQNGTAWWLVLAVLTIFCIILCGSMIKSLIVFEHDAAIGVCLLIFCGIIPGIFYFVWYAIEPKEAKIDTILKENGFETKKNTSYQFVKAIEENRRKCPSCQSMVSGSDYVCPCCGAYLSVVKKNNALVHEN